MVMVDNCESRLGLSNILNDFLNQTTLKKKNVLYTMKNYNDTPFVFIEQIKNMVSNLTNL